MANLVCIGAPYFIGERIAGRTAVEQIRMSGVAEKIGAAWIDIAPDFEDAPDPITAVNRALADAIRDHADQVPLIFAGDCMASIGAIKGLSANAEGHLGVIWYDAHGDFNTPDTTPSGFLGGMPLAMLVGRGDQQYLKSVDLAPLDERDILITDARDLDPEEEIALRASAITHLPATNDLLAADLPDQPLYIHLDVDVIRTDDMPAVSYPTSGGPSLADTADTLARIARDGEVVGLLFSLWSAEKVVDGRSLANTLRLVFAFLDAMGA